MDDGLKMWIGIAVFAILLLVLGPPALYYLSLWLAFWLGAKAASIIVAMVAIFSIVGAVLSIVFLIIYTND